MADSTDYESLELAARVRKREERQQVREQKWRLEREKRKKVEEQRKRRAKERLSQQKKAASVSGRKGKAIISNNSDLINMFLDIAERKVSARDDYGDQSWDVLPQEIATCLKKLGRNASVYIDAEYDDIKEKWSVEAISKGRASLNEFDLRFWRSLPKYLENKFKKHHAIVAHRSTSFDDINSMSGVEFETWVGRLIVTLRQGFETNYVK
jgi:hypothetical protein